MEGIVPDNLLNLIDSEKDEETLKRMLRFAAKAESIEEFRKKCGA